LLGLADGGAVTSPGLNQPEPQASETLAPAQQPEQADPPISESGGAGTGTIIFVLITVAIAGVAGYYFKIVKSRKEARRPRNTRTTRMRTTRTTGISLTRMASPSRARRTRKNDLTMPPGHANHHASGKRRHK
jgi:uncharacterized protein HemX